MTCQSRFSKGMLTLDAMMSIIPTMMIFVFLMQSMALVSDSDTWESNRQDLFDRLVSVADYSVKSGLAIHGGNVRHPNWVNGTIDSRFIEEIREKGGFTELEISFREPDMGNCIYRLVVVGEQKKLSKLYFCGE